MDFYDSLQRLSSEEVKLLCKEIYDKLQAREKDLLIAADIAQELLVQKQNLEDQMKNQGEEYYKKIKAEVSATSDNEDLMYIRQLEGKLHEANSEIANANQKIVELEREIAKKSKDIEDINSGTAMEKDELKNKSIENEELAEKLQRKINENNQLKKKIQSLQDQEEIMWKRIKEIEDENEEIKTKFVTDKSKDEDIETIRREFKEYKDIAEDKLENLNQANENYEMAMLDLEQSRQLLNDYKQTIEFLTNKLNPKKEMVLESDSENKTLFSEVEDRRVELENKFVNLQKSHEGLLKVHTLSLHEQEKMKIHITRLSELSKNQSDEAKVKRLEVRVAQLSSENQELINELDKYAKNKALHGDLELQSTSGSSSGRDMITLLRCQIKNVTEENDRLKKEIQTYRLIHVDDSEKMRKIEIEIDEKEQQIHDLRVKVSDLQFQIDEIKLADKIKKVNEEYDEIVKENRDLILDKEKDELPSASQLGIKVEKIESENQVDDNPDKENKESNKRPMKHEPKHIFVKKEKIQAGECKQQ